MDFYGFLWIFMDFLDFLDFLDFYSEKSWIFKTLLILSAKSERNEMCLVLWHWHVSVAAIVGLRGNRIRNDWQVVGNTRQRLHYEVDARPRASQILRRDLQELHLLPPVLEEKYVAVFWICQEMKTVYETNVRTSLGDSLSRASNVSLP